MAKVYWGTPGLTDWYLADAKIRDEHVELTAAEVESRKNAVPVAPVLPQHDSFILSMSEDQPWEDLMNAIAAINSFRGQKVHTAWMKLGESAVLNEAGVQDLHNRALALPGFVLPLSVTDAAIATWNARLTANNITTFTFRDSVVAAADSEPIASVNLGGG